MSKAIMISIKPKYVADILNGRKTIEIRKTMPKCDLPIDVCIYCTKDKVGLYDNHNHITSASDEYFLDPFGYDKPPLLNGKVVAKFTLNKVEKVYRNQYGINSCITDTIVSPHEFEKMCCLKGHEIYVNYLCGKDRLSLFAWHISNLVIFDKPKELNEFKIPCDFKCPKLGCCYCHKNTRLTKAPQSWCYVDVSDYE